MATVALEGVQKAASFLVPVESSKSSYCSHFSANWRLIPALATLVIMIMGVALAALVHYNLMTIPFAIGTVASSYLVYLSYHYGLLSDFATLNKKLKGEVQSLTEQNNSFKKSNAELSTHNQTYHEENERLSGEVRTLGSSNASLKANLTMLGGQVEKISSHAVELEKQIGALSTENQDLQAAVSQLREQIGKLSDLNTGLGQVREALAAYSVGQKDSLTRLDQSIADLLKLVAPHESAMQNFSNQVAELSRNTELAREAVHESQSANQAFRATVDQFASFAKALLNNDQLRKLSEEVGEARGALSSYREQLEKLKAEIAKLEKVDSSLQASSGQLAQHIAALPGAAASAAAATNMAAK